MRGFGIFVILAGALLLFSALAMDVSVPSGLGRVNNLGLMSERQNYTIIGGILLIAGILIAMRSGGKGAAAPDVANDTRACPFCAEQIKRAAVKCKHCGADVEPDIAAAIALEQGWVASIPCRPGEEKLRANEAIAELGFPAVPMDGTNIGAGPFATKKEAKLAVHRLSTEYKIFAEVDYRDIVSGRFPPISRTLLNGWTVRIPVANTRSESLIELLKKIDVPFIAIDGDTVVTGPYESENAAKAVVIRLSDTHNIQSNIYWIPTTA